jgi:Predicted ATP-dependent serine protease
MSSLIFNVWKKLPGKFFCISTKDGDDRWRDHFFAPEELPEARLKIKNEWVDRNIYFCPHGFNRRNRQKGDAVMPMMLWADLDHVDPRKIDIKPTIAIESSPGRFVGLWVLTGKQVDLEYGESLNRRLTYHLGCDLGGWDITQVLRMPGTRNYKYKSQPRVRVLWDDGPTWSIGKLERVLPEDPHGDKPEGDELDAAEVFGKYQKKLPIWVRRELTATRQVGRHDRSEMLWKLENECIEAGMDMDEAFAVIRSCVWNKFAGRRNEEQQLRGEIQKAVELHFRNNRKKDKDGPKDKSDEERQEEDDPHARGRFSLKPLGEVERENINWLWYPYMARGEITIIEGDPGLGKSYFVQIVAAHIASKKALPVQDSKPKEKGGAVVYFDFENSMASVTKPRIEDNGFVGLKRYYQQEVPFTIDDDEAMEEAYELLREAKPKLLVFDTLNTYIGRADTHKASETAQAFGIFKQLARDFNCAVVVIRHLTKSGGSAINRGQGSIVFTGTARMVYVVGVDPQDHDTRVVCCVKNNLTRAPNALTFTIEGRPKGKSAFLWTGFSKLTAQEVLDASATARKEGGEGEGVQVAMEFIEEHCLNATMSKDKLMRMAEKRGVDPDMVERAARRMGVKVKKRGKLGTEEWSLKRKETEED